MPQSLKDKRPEVVEKLKKLQADTEPILKIFVDPDVTKQIGSSRSGAKLGLENGTVFTECFFCSQGL